MLASDQREQRRVVASRSQQAPKVSAAETSHLGVCPYI